MALSKVDVRDLIMKTAFPAFRDEKVKLDRIDRWYRWDHDKPHQPRRSTTEYQELMKRSQTPWLGLVVTNVAQMLYVEGYRRRKEPDDAKPWETWQANGMDARQIPLHRAALAYGLAYETVLPGENPFGERMAVMRGKSPRRMIAFYRDPAGDEFPEYALECDPAKVDGRAGWALKFYDSENIYRLQADAGCTKVTYIDYLEHNVGVTPVVRFANMLDLEGRADGEVEPFISIAARIDQTIFDRLVVQRFASWVVRTISGMSAIDQREGETDEQYAERTKMRLRVEDILVAEDKDTKFGTLPASDMKGFIDAREADVRDLAAVTQTPPHHLLGQMANLSAEALAAAESAASRKTDERQHALGEPHEQALRLAARINGDMDSARDFGAQVRWKDMESRSLAQVADALGKIATQLGVPVEGLWERIPGVTQTDIDTWKALAEQGGGLEQLMRQLADSQTTPPAE